MLGERVTRYILGEDVPDHMEATVLAGTGRRIEVELAVKAVVRAGPDTVFVALVRDVTRARRESRIARLLADTSEIVAGARDEVAAIRAISQLLVPAIADWCAFDVQDLDGSLTRIAVAHVTPQGEALLWELDRRFPVRQFEGNLRARVLRSGTPLVMNTITDSVIRATARNREHAEMLRDLGMGAAMWVPATSLGRTFGVMSLGRIASDRPFDDVDLDVAAKLGHRAAQAIEWMGKGWMMPAAVRASTVSWRTPRSAKVVLGVAVAGAPTCSEGVGSAPAAAVSAVEVVSVMVRDVVVADSGSLLVCS